jgi:hypothetical protein
LARFFKLADDPADDFRALRDDSISKGTISSFVQFNGKPIIHSTKLGCSVPPRDGVGGLRLPRSGAIPRLAIV